MVVTTVNEVNPPHCERCDRELFTREEINRSIDLGTDLCDHCYAGDGAEEDECWCGYGFYHGGDPRQFSPDEEMNNPAEITRWLAACEAWERGAPSAPEPEEHGPWTDPETGTVTIGVKPSPTAVGACHALRSFGLGAYYCDRHRLPADAWQRWKAAP